MGFRQLHDDVRAALARPLLISSLTSTDRAAIEKLVAQADQLAVHLPDQPPAAIQRASLLVLRSLVDAEIEIMRSYGSG